MQKLELSQLELTKGAAFQAQEDGSALFRLSKDGAGFRLLQLKDCSERYFTFRVRVMEEHSLPMNLLVYVRGEKDPAFTVRLGLLPGVDTFVCIDREWMNARELFPEALAGMLKIVCHGRRVDREEISDIVLSSMASFHDVECLFSELELTDVRPEEPVLPERKMIDCFGQCNWKDWPGKTKNVEELREKLLTQVSAGISGYPFEDWSAWGGWKRKKLQEGTGFFSKCKKEGRWWLTDPEGYAFFSMGPDCVGVSGDCRIDGVEKWLDWLPEREDPSFGALFREAEHAVPGHRRRMRQFSFFQANLIRAFGDSWQEDWERMMCGQLKAAGMNTMGNWSDDSILGKWNMPYVTSLPEFPATTRKIFRDFPDVFSWEYQAAAERCAGSLTERRDDPLMIGYFLRNEPAWAFVDNLVLADEVLYNPERTACKELLIEFLRDRYGDINKLNDSWHSSLESFESLWQPRKDVSKWSQGAREDMRCFSRRMLRAYVEIPARECRKVDPNHMILGMRWAWISDPDLVIAWENFDVFSINCYAVDPTDRIQRVVDLGVDLPVMIGEFHFGALDAGLPATGLKGVKSQKDRGMAYRYYCESVATHPYGVGCHYFQCYDQFALGRFDGENYNIGLFDICSCAYEEMMEEIQKCSGRIYRVAAGEIGRCPGEAQPIPMVAY